MVHNLRPTLTHGSKKSLGHCDGKIPVSGISLPTKLHEGSWKSFPNRPVKTNASSKPTLCQVISLGIGTEPLRSMAFSVGGGHPERRNRDNLNIPGAKGTGKLLLCSALTVTMNHVCEMEGSDDHSGTKCTNNK